MGQGKILQCDCPVCILLGEVIGDCVNGTVRKIRKTQMSGIAARQPEGNGSLIGCGQQGGRVPEGQSPRVPLAEAVGCQAVPGAVGSAQTL